MRDWWPMAFVAGVTVWSAATGASAWVTVITTACLVVGLGAMVIGRVQRARIRAGVR
ncbi:MAG: hypothetical protein QM650_05990 [Microlunatus sp.]